MHSTSHTCGNRNKINNIINIKTKIKERIKNMMNIEASVGIAFDKAAEAFNKLADALREADEMQKNSIIFVGDKVTFDPIRDITIMGMRKRTKDDYVIGTVIKVYYEHYWFLVEYELGGQILHAGFKCDELGRSVFKVKKKG